jgi:hypothetical protein
MRSEDRPSSFELYRQEGANFRSVRVRIENDTLTLDTHDMGKTTEEVFGDSDYEFWTAVPKEAWGDLSLALIKEFLSGDPRATDRLREICAKHGVMHKWDRWI